MSIVKELQKVAKKFKVLYVEDDKSLQNQTATFLRNFFIDLDLANDGEEGLKKAINKHYDIIITDIKMPKLSGIDMIKEIRKRAKPNHIEYIVISAFDNTELLIKALENGVSGYVLKPIEPEILMDTLNKAIKSHLAQMKIEQLNNKLSLMLNYQNNLVMLASNQEIHHVNKTFLNKFEYASLNDVKENKHKLGLEFIKEKGYFYPENIKEWLNELISLKEHITYAKFINRVTHEEEDFIINKSATSLENIYVISFTKLKDLMEDMKKIVHQASIDPLTNLINKYKFNGILDGVIREVTFFNIEYSLIYFEIKNYSDFKNIKGRDFCDLITVQLVRKVQEVLSEKDIFAKVKENQFAILFNKSQVDSTKLVAKIKTLVHRETFSENTEIDLLFSVTQLQSGENRKDLINRVRSYQFICENKNYDILNDTIFNTKESKIYAQESKRIIDLFLSIKEKNEIFKISSFYKGIPVTTNGKIVHIENNTVTIRFLKEQSCAFIFKKDEYIYITSESFNSKIKAKIDYVDMLNGDIKLSMFTPKESTALNRKYIRIVPKDTIKVAINFHDKIIEGKLLDLSSASIAIVIDTNKFIKRNDYVELNFQLNKYSFNSSAQVALINKYDDLNFKIIFNLFMNKKDEAEMGKYILSRQMEIIREIKEDI